MVLKDGTVYNKENIVHGVNFSYLSDTFEKTHVVHGLDSHYILDQCFSNFITLRYVGFQFEKYYIKVAYFVAWNLG